MILFVTGQYAGAQYIHPLIDELDANNKWKIVADGASIQYWDRSKIEYDQIISINSESISEYLDSTKPDLIILSASAHIELEHLVILQAKKRKIHTASFIDTWTNYKVRFKYQGEMLLPDEILAIDERHCTEMVNDGIPKNLIKIIGQPYLEKICLSKPGLGEEILLVGQPIKKYYRKELGYDEDSFYEECLNALSKLNVKNVTIVRHPEEIMSKELSLSEGISIKNGCGEDSLLTSHTIIGMFSTQLITGYLWDRKVASFQKEKSNFDLCPLSRWGLIPVLKNERDIIDFILNDKLIGVNPLKNSIANSVVRLKNYCNEKTS